MNLQLVTVQQVSKIARHFYLKLQWYCQGACVSHVWRLHEVGREGGKSAPPLVFGQTPRQELRGLGKVGENSRHSFCFSAQRGLKNNAEEALVSPALSVPLFLK